MVLLENQPASQFTSRHPLDAAGHLKKESPESV